MLKSIGPKMDPCGTPDSRMWNILWTVDILNVFGFFQRFSHEYKKVRKPSLKP